MAPFNTGMRRQLQTLIEKQKLEKQNRVEVEAPKEPQNVAHRQYVSQYAAYAGGFVWVEWRQKDGTLRRPFRCFCTDVEPDGLIVSYSGKTEKLRFGPRLIVRNEAQKLHGKIAGKVKHYAKLAQESYAAAEAEAQRLTKQVQELTDKLQRQREYLDARLKETFGMLTRDYGQAARLGLVPERVVRQ